MELGREGRKRNERMNESCYSSSQNPIMVPCCLTNKSHTPQNGIRTLSRPAYLAHLTLLILTVRETSHSHNFYYIYCLCFYSQLLISYCDLFKNYTLSQVCKYRKRYSIHRVWYQVVSGIHRGSWNRSPHYRILQTRSPFCIRLNC